MRESLQEVGAGSAVELLSSYAGQASDLRPWIRGAEINRDRDLRLQYLGGWGINSAMADYLYRQIIRFRRPPAKLFTGTPEKVQLLLSAIYTQTGG